MKTSLLWMFTAILLIAAGAEAQLNRSFVSTAGSDANPCTAAAPCRSFDAAIAQTNAGGEVLAVDSGGYGPFTVTKELTVVAAPGVHAAVSALSGTAVSISAGMSDSVVLRRLVLTGLGADEGLASAAGEAVYVDACTVSGFISAGIAFRHNGHAFVTDSTVQENQPNFGILFAPSDGIQRGTVDRTRMLRNNVGLRVAGGATVVVNQSVAAGNYTTVGFQTVAGEFTSADLTIKSSVASNNWIGIFAYAEEGRQGESIVRISDVTVTGNENFGLTYTAGAQILSFENNDIAGNTIDGVPSGVLARQ